MLDLTFQDIQNLKDIKIVVETLFVEQFESWFRSNSKLRIRKKKYRMHKKYAKTVFLTTSSYVMHFPHYSRILLLYWTLFVYHRLR